MFILTGNIESPVATVKIKFSLNWGSYFEPRFSEIVRDIKTWTYKTVIGPFFFSASLLNLLPRVARFHTPNEKRFREF